MFPHLPLFFPLKTIREKQDHVSFYGDEALRLGTAHSLQSLDSEQRRFESELATERSMLAVRKRIFLFASLFSALILLAATIVFSARSHAPLGFALIAVSVLALWYGWNDDREFGIAQQAMLHREAFRLARGIREAIDAEVQEAIRYPTVLILPPPIFLHSEPVRILPASPPLPADLKVTLADPPSSS